MLPVDDYGTVKTNFVLNKQNNDTLSPKMYSGAVQSK
jgi:hypothetical protein